VRSRCAVVFAWLAVAAGALVCASVAAATSPLPPGGSYPWAQPGAIHAVAPGHLTQPPAVSTVVPLGMVTGPDTSHPWVQPWMLQGGATPDVGHWTQPPVATG
jgi:hypothetical protein